MPGAMPQAILMSPRWGYAWGGAPGYINVAPLGLCLNAIKLRYNLLIFNHFLCVLGWGTRFFTFNKNNDLRPHPYINIRHDRAFFNKNIEKSKSSLT